MFGLLVSDTTAKPFDETAMWLVGPFESEADAAAFARDSYDAQNFAEPIYDWTVLPLYAVTS